MSNQSIVQDTPLEARMISPYPYESKPGSCLQEQTMQEDIAREKAVSTKDLV